MLDFFRRYQSAFLSVTAILVIVSFIFYGTFSTFSSQDAPRNDKLLGYTVNGSKIMLFDVQKLSRFIATDRNDAGPGVSPNFCNDGVIRTDFLQSHLGDVLVAEYFDFLKESLE